MNIIEENKARLKEILKEAVLTFGTETKLFCKNMR